MGQGYSFESNWPTQEGSSANDWKKLIAPGIALKNDNTLWSWGRFSLTRSGIPLNYPTQEKTHSRWAQVTKEKCGIKQDGTLWCWIAPWIAVDEDPENPVQEPTNGRWTAIADECALNADGSIWCWSQNQNIVQEPSSSYEWLDVKTRGPSRCARKNDLSLWCWEHGEAPTREPTNSEWISYEVAWSKDFIGIKSDGTLWRGYRQLGTSTYSMVQEQGQDTWITIDFNCAIRADGTSWCYKDTELQQEPSLSRKWTMFKGWGAPEGGTTCGIKDDNTLWCYGAEDVNNTTIPQREDPCLLYPAQ